MPDTQLTLRLLPDVAERLGRLVDGLAEDENFATLAPVTRTSMLRACVLAGLRRFEKDYDYELSESTEYRAPERPARPGANVAGRVIMPVAMPNFLIARAERLIPVLEADPERPRTGPIPRSAVLHMLLVCGIETIEREYLGVQRHSIFSNIRHVPGDWAIDPEAPGRRPNGEGRRTKSPAAKKEG